MGGAGSTGRSERMLNEALQRAGGRHAETRSFWLARPNDEARHANAGPMTRHSKFLSTTRNLPPAARSWSAHNGFLRFA